MQSNGTFNDPPIEFNTSTSLPHISEMAFAQFNPGGNAVAECLVSNTPEPRGELRLEGRELPQRDPWQPVRGRPRLRRDLEWICEGESSRARGKRAQLRN